MNKDQTLYTTKCLEKCASIPVPKCPYEACMVNCKRTNCTTRCSDKKDKPIIICESECRNYENIRVSAC